MINYYYKYESQNYMCDYIQRKDGHSYCCNLLKMRVIILLDNHYMHLLTAKQFSVEQYSDTIPVDKMNASYEQLSNNY